MIRSAVRIVFLTLLCSFLAAGNLSATPYRSLSDLSLQEYPQYESFGGAGGTEEGAPRSGNETVLSPLADTYVKQNDVTVHGSETRVLAKAEKGNISYGYI